MYNNGKDSGQDATTGKYYLFSITALLIWSTSFIGTKIAYATFQPITLGALRFVIASIVLGITIFLKKEYIRPSLRDIGTMCISGLLGITLYFTLENTGVNLTTASNASLIVASYPAITALLELVIYKIKPSIFKSVGIFFAIVGVYILTSKESNEDGHAQFIGNMILLLSGVVWAFYNFATQKIINKYPAVTVSFYQTIAGTICFIPLMFFERKNWQAPTSTTLLVLIYLGVFCSVAAFLMYNYGLRKISSGTAVSLMNLVPVFGVIFSVLILHEAVTWKQVLGGLVVIFGVILSVNKRN